MVVLWYCGIVNVDVFGYGAWHCRWLMSFCLSLFSPSAVVIDNMGLFDGDVRRHATAQSVNLSTRRWASCVSECSGP